MQTAIELGRWREKPAGLAARRRVIVSTGLRQLFRTRFFKILLVLAWTAGVLMAAAGFLFTQALATGGWFESWAAEFGPQARAVVSAFCSLVLLYPDICITGLFTALFWVHSHLALLLCLLALTSVVPQLIARDRAHNALTLYLSRPLTSLDYLLGKLGIIVGIILLLWTGPLLLGWLLSMAFATGTDFLVHSFSPLCRALLFNLIALVTLAAVALGISSLGKSPRTVLPLWFGAWIVLGFLAAMPLTPAPLRAASFGHGLRVTRQAIFRFDEILRKAGETLPFMNQKVSDKLAQAGRRHEPANTTQAAAGLAAIVLLSTVVFARKLRPED